MATNMIKLAALAIMCMVVMAPLASDAALTCGTVFKAVTPCLGYLRGSGAPTSACCSSVSSLNKQASTTPDRQQACKCLKQAAHSFTGINLSNAKSLPKKCGVNVPFKISLSTNCASIK